MVTPNTSGAADISPRHSVPPPRTGRPVNPTSLRQSKPWLKAEVSERTYYRALATWRKADPYNLYSFDTIRVINDLPRLLAVAQANDITVAQVLDHWITYDSYNPAEPVADYVSARTWRARDKAKRARTTKHRSTTAESIRRENVARPELDSLGSIVCTKMYNDATPGYIRVTKAGYTRRKVNQNRSTLPTSTANPRHTDSDSSLISYVGSGSTKIVAEMTQYAPAPGDRSLALLPFEEQLAAFKRK